MPTSTGYTRSPRLQQGALIQLNPAIVGVIPIITLFQYNPETINRSFQMASAGGGEDSEGLVSKDDESFPPGESYSFKLELDATDDLEKGRPLAETYGVADRIAVLERLIYAPPDAFSAVADSIVTLFADGPLKRASKQVVPIVLLALGRRRVMPVRVSSLSVTETAHNPAMMPIHAEVDLSFDVIQPHELPKFVLGSPQPRVDVLMARAAYTLYRFQRDQLALAHIATVVSDAQG